SPSAGTLSAPPILPDSGTIQTEVEILKSPELAGKVIRELDLQDEPELVPGPPLGERLRPLAERYLGTAVADGLLGAPPSFEQAKAAKASLIVEAFLRKLRVGPKETSRMIDVAFESKDPHLAMRVANAMADAYLRNQLELRSRMAQRTSE